MYTALVTVMVSHKIFSGVTCKHWYMYTFQMSVNFYIEQKPCNHSQIRLNDDINASGRVEVCLDGQWGTVCDCGWTRHDANTVCRQLGYINHSMYKPFSSCIIILANKMYSKSNSNKGSILWQWKWTYSSIGG